MNYNKLRTQINAYIKRNGKQEITGPVLNGVLNAMVDSLASGSLYAGILSPGSELPSLDSNAFMLCGPGEYSVGGSPAEVGIGQLGILSNASGQWKMETVQVVDVLQEVDSDSAQTSPNPASVSATMKFLDSYLKPGNLASIISDWGRFFSKIDTISDITDPLDFSETNYLTKEENLKDACVQLDEEVKAANDNIEILGAEAKNLEKAKQDKLSAGTGIAISDGEVSVSLARNSMTPIRSGEDLDDITIPGIYCSQSNPVSGILNIPKGLNKSFVMFVAETGSVNEYVQLIIGSYMNNDMFIRGCYNNANWQAWQQVSTSGNFSKLFGSSMRSLYEACGAVWNEETGYYELNGLTDITEEQMMWIYIETFGWWTEYGPVCRYSRHARTNLRPQSYGIRFISNDATYPFGESVFETINLVALWSSDPERYAITVNNNVKIFYNCPGLREITGKISLIKGTSALAFYIADRCSLLKEIRVEIYNNTADIIFCKDSPLLSYESVKYLVDNAANTEAVIVTISPATYSYLSGTAQPAAEVGGTTEEWQALMTTAAGKQISFATEE